MSTDNYQSVENAFREGTVDAQDSETLGNFLFALANQPLPNEFVRHRDIIRGFTVNHILLQRHIAALDKKNARTTALVVVLTVVAVITGAIQIWYADKADRRAEAESVATEARQRAQAQQLENPSPSSLQASRPATSTQATNAGAYPAKSTEIRPSSSPSQPPPR